MCLAVPGKLIEIQQGSDLGERFGKVDMQGSQFDVNLSFVPDAQLGAWLLVHAGFAIEMLDEEEARRVWDVLKEDETLAEHMPPEFAQNAKED
jgi:hydrogenase expression/formation protein HypC